MWRIPENKILTIITVGATWWLHQKQKIMNPVLWIHKRMKGVQKNQMKKNKGIELLNLRHIVL